MDVQTLIERIKLSDYIKRYCALEYKDNEYWCLSPFSGTDTDPSFSIRDEDYVYYDFSDGSGGNILTFIQKYHKVSFPRALKMAADFAGIHEEITSEHSADIGKIMRQFAPRKAAKEDLAEHIILARDVMERYDTNAPQLSIWEDEGISREAMEKFQIRYDWKNERIVYPIRMENGDIISIAGRTTHKDYKAEKLRKYTYYNSIGTADFLLGLYENKNSILDKREIIVFEGIKSVLKVRSWNIFNAVAVSTSHISVEQMRLLLRLGCSVIFAFDQGIDERSDKNVKKLCQFCNVYYLPDKDKLLPEKASPADCGKEVWEQLYEGKRRIR